MTDVPKGGANLLNMYGTDIISTDKRMEYVGQRIAMVLAWYSQMRMQRAQAWCLESCAWRAVAGGDRGQAGARALRQAGQPGRAATAQGFYELGLSQRP